MSALVYGFVRAAAAGWGDPLTIASFASAAALLAAFVGIELRAQQPITPLRLFASRERSGAYVARIVVVGSMFSMFFFLSQLFQGARGYDALQAGLAFLPMTLVMFSMVRTVPRLIRRYGELRLLVFGLSVALTGMVWLSRVTPTTGYATGIALPLVLLGLGMGMAFAPLTTAGIAGVAAEDAGAASGVVNAAHQLGGSLGLSVLVTVFASSLRGAAPAGARVALSHAVASTITGSALLLAIGLLVSVTAIAPARIRESRLRARVVGA
jgi:predicted MFS family arabinose efflux permease